MDLKAHRGARFIVLAGTVILLAACTSKDEQPDDSVAAEYYVSWGCDLCHGDDGSGNELGPSLHDLNMRWTAERLSEYLYDPASFRDSDPWFQELETYYPEATMPAYDYPAEQRQALAAWLIRASSAR
jgi:cytochrome c2